MKNVRRLLGTLLAVMLLVAGVPVAVSAQEAGTVSESVADYGTGYQKMTLIPLGEIEHIPVRSAQYSTAASEYWDKFGSDYFYQQMNSSERAFYDGLYAAAMSLLSGTRDADFSVAGGQILYHLPFVYSDSLGVEQAQVIASIFQMSNPQFYFINDMMLWGYDSQGIQIGLCVYNDFADGIVRSMYTSQFKSNVENLLAQVNAQPDPVSRERKAHDLILSITSYVYGNYHQSCAGVFLEGEAVCAGYAEAFALLCNGAGIEAISVTSRTHEWNKVRLYGRWYGVDCTWDDTGAGRYEYFNVTDAYLEGADTDHKLEDIWSGYQVPVCVNSTVIEQGSYLYQGVDYSDVFDEYYYVDRYPDLKAAFGSDSEAALAHFVQNGMREGRQASAAFDVYAYRARYKDLREAFGSDLQAYYQHYISNGKQERRVTTGTHMIADGVTIYCGTDYSSVYNYSDYKKMNPDIASAFPNDDFGALEHFVLFGMREGRRASSTFDVESYRLRYKDLRTAFGRDLTAYYNHYIRNGRMEGRKATGAVSGIDGVTVYNGVDYSALYDFSYYMNAHPDLRTAFGSDDIAALEHFVQFGMSEGRQAAESFNPGLYRSRYADLDAAFGNNWSAYYGHYLENGIREGRVAK
ncbi:MAG: hypothetical protein K2O73_01340 [Lachnospiraceae bacterium]|nr:hypothetical protein [Lachnospiraceae bacterium]